MTGIPPYSSVFHRSVILSIRVIDTICSFFYYYAVMKTKIIIGIVVLAILAVLFVRTWGDTTEKIGVLAPLSGPAAALGEWSRQGIVMAQNEINEKGGINGKKIELIIEDDVCDGKKSVDAFKKLHELQNIKFIIGPLCGAARIPVLSAANGSDVVMMTTGLAFAHQPVFNVPTFNVLPTVESVSDAIIEYGFNKLGYMKYSHLYSEDEYGKSNDAEVQSKISELGGTLISSESEARGSTDLRTQILKLKNNKSEAIIASTYGPDYAVLLKQARDLGMNKPILAISSIQTPEPAAADKATGQKVYYSYPASSDYPSVLAFAEKFRAANPKAPAFLPMYIGAGYDSFTLLAAALNSCNDGKVACVSKYLHDVKYNGANGPVSFNEIGNNSNSSSIEIRVLEDGIFKTLK